MKVLFNTRPRIRKISFNFKTILVVHGLFIIVIYTVLDAFELINQLFDQANNLTKSLFSISWTEDQSVEIFNNEVSSANKNITFDIIENSIYVHQEQQGAEYRTLRHTRKYK